MKFQGSAYLQIVVIMFGFAALSQTASANDISGLYVGGNLGLARIDYDNALYQDQIESQAAGLGTLDFTSAYLHKRNTAWWVDTGYMVSPYLGIEASYLHFGALSDRVSGNFTQTGGTPEAVILATSLGSKGPALGLIFRLPLTDSFAVNLRLADYYGRTNLINTLDATKQTSTRETANNSSLLAALGAAYTFYGHWSAHLDYLRVNQAGNSSNVVRYDVDMASVGLSYTF